jgi:hypothetical protein
MTIMKKILATTSALAVVLIAGLATFGRHGVWEREIGTDLIWSADKAHFFAARLREGWSGNYLELAWEAARHFVGLPGRRTDQKRWLEITTITSKGSTRSVFPESAARPLGVFDNHVYAADNGKLVKWVDSQLMPVSSDEEARFHRDTDLNAEFKNVNGWSKEINIARGSPGNSSYELMLDGVPVLVMTRQDPNRSVVSVKFADGTVTTMLDVQHDYVLMDDVSYRRAFSTTRQ